jgi:hypothetical protein
MSDDQSLELAAAELEDLKERAKLLGVKHHPSIGADALREKIKEFQEAADAATKDDAAAPAAPVAEVVQQLSAKELEARRIAAIRSEAEKLIRIRVTCMNPAKKDWNGEIITVSNRAVGTLKKFVPFNADDGWHIPNMLYQVMKARECQVFVTVKSKNGVSVRKGKLIKEFAIEVLDPLTPQEIGDLARVQAMAAGQE